MSSGEAFFLTSCMILTAVSMSTCRVSETSDTLEPEWLPSLVFEAWTLVVGDRSEFDLETVDSRLCRCPASAPISSSSFEAKFVSTGEARSDFPFRLAFATGPFSLTAKSEYLEDTDTGESTLPTFGEFVFVFGLDSLCWLLWAFPISDYVCTEG